MANIEITPSGIWHLRWRDKNGKHRSKSLKTKSVRDAKAALKVFEAELEARADAPKVVSYTIDDLRSLYLAHADKYYRQDGRPTSEAQLVKQALLALDPYASLLVTDFTPKALRKVRDTWEYRKKDDGKPYYARTTVNKYVDRVRRMFLWGVSEEIVPTDIAWALKSLPGLRRGRSEARESKKKQPIPLEHIKTVQSNVSDVLGDLIQVQYLSAARPSEILDLRVEDFTVTEGQVWKAEILHKTYYKTGKKAVLQFGLQAQTILSPYLERKAGYVFVPPGKSKFTTDAYHHAVRKVCTEAGIPLWTPHRLRHTRLTEVRNEFGLEQAQAVGRHEHADTTEIYAQRNEELASSVLAEMG